MIETPIFTPDGSQCGSYTWSLFNTPEDQGHRYIKFMDRIPAINLWPLALFEDIQIHETSRRRGYGRRGVKQFIQEAKSNGAVCSLLKVGWNFFEDPETARIWKTAFYASEGFIELPWDMTEPVLMYQQLNTP